MTTEQTPAGRDTTDRITTLTVRFPQAELDELERRVRASRLPAVLGDGSDETGFTTAAAREMLRHWREEFDWRDVESEINAFDNVLVDVGAATGEPGQRVHVARARATAPAGTSTTTPIVLLHGWPDSFLRYRHLVGPLTAAGHDVYLPSLPGFGFSDQPTGPATVEAAATAVGAALAELGVPTYAVHGGDWGSSVAEQLAVQRPDTVAALHLSDVPWTHVFSVDRTQATEAEQRFYADGEAWAAQAAYLSVQASQATTLALALADSPVGLASWWAEKYHAWTDGAVGWDEVLAQVCLTWLTRTEHSGMRYYAAMGGSWDDDGAEEGWDEAWQTSGEEEATADGDAGAGWGDLAMQPTAVAVFPADIHQPPREHAARAFPGLCRFTLMPRGGHFAALEHPDLLAADLLDFVADVSQDVHPRS